MLLTGQEAEIHYEWLKTDKQTKKLQELICTEVHFPQHLYNRSKESNTIMSGIKQQLMQAVHTYDTSAVTTCAPNTVFMLQNKYENIPGAGKGAREEETVLAFKSSTQSDYQLCVLVPILYLLLDLQKLSTWTVVKTGELIF